MMTHHYCFLGYDYFLNLDNQRTAHYHTKISLDTMVVGNTNPSATIWVKNRYKYQNPDLEGKCSLDAPTKNFDDCLKEALMAKMKSKLSCLGAWMYNALHNMTGVANCTKQSKADMAKKEYEAEIEALLKDPEAESCSVHCNQV